MGNAHQLRMGGNFEQAELWQSARIWLLGAAAIFTLIAIYGSLVPHQFRAVSLRVAIQQFRQIPFLHLTIESRSDWVSNILLFMPLGYFWLVALSVGRSRLVALTWALLLVPTLAGLSMAIEFTQIWFPARTASQNDIAAESLGALIGALAWIGCGNYVTRWMGSYFAIEVPASPIAWLLLAYLAGFILYSLLPLDLTIRPGELALKYREGIISLVPFADLGSIWDAATRLAIDVLLAVPIGALAGSLRTTSSSWRLIVTATLKGVAVIAAIELAQVFVFSRTASLTDVVLGGVGVSIGVLVFRSGELRLAERTTT
ncbi:VanZ family protein [Anatilimnocola sp. NA78]|uniref:VanZ family protein n=1 Tax=Anatilimnocola sp. NA78 TaxID=3415683 RepID=UPI003CE59EB1